jgi:hypothetical protein
MKQIIWMFLASIPLHLSSQTIASLKNQLAECEQQNRKLSERLSTAAGGATQTIEKGYGTVYINVHIRDQQEMVVKVNGSIIGNYSKTANITLDDYFKRNAINVITFTFNPVTTTSESDVEVVAKFAGNDQSKVIFNFTPRKNKSETQFGVPFTGKVD